MLVPFSGSSSAWLERCVRDAEAAGSNPVSPTFLNFWPFGENVEQLSLCNTKTYAAYSTVQTQRFQQIAFYACCSVAAM